MKKQIILVVIIATAFVQNIFAQTDSTQSFNNVITAYINLKNALTIDNGDSARAAAKVLFNAIDKIPMEKLSADKRKIWMQYQEKLSYDAEHIKSTDDIEHQREHFISLSKNMYGVAKAFNTNTANLYYQFCPMANDGKGAYWLSETEQIHNPYFGKKMPTCGSTKETISPVK
jgi:hypothetical protein